MGNGRIFKMNTPLDIEQDMIPLKSYFISTGFIDMLPTALSMARELNYGFNEVAEAICKVGDKSKQYPPIKNRTAWFLKKCLEKIWLRQGQIFWLTGRKKDTDNRFYRLTSLAERLVFCWGWTSRTD